MLPSIIPQKLSPGDHIRVITPATSAARLDPAMISLAKKHLEDMGLIVSFGKHIYELDAFGSSAVQRRVEDLHDAFLDQNVQGILTMVGGFNSNQMLRYIDWEIIKNHPKIFCGYSDITVLANAIYAKTGLVTYSGMHFSTFGQMRLDNYSVQYFTRCLFNDDTFFVLPSEQWSDDRRKNWQLSNRELKPSDGWWVVQEGEATGKTMGGNIASLRLLYGTEYMPSLQDTILFLEDDHYTTNDIAEFDRNLQSLIHQPGFTSVQALIIGRFQEESLMTRTIIEQIIATKPELHGMPVVANVDFGHTDPLMTFPIGGKARLVLKGQERNLEILMH